MSEAEKIIDTAIQEWDEIALSTTPTSTPLATHIVRALREAGMLTETEWEWATALRTPSGELWDHEIEDEEGARQHARECDVGKHEGDHDPDVCFLVRRRRAIDAGPWSPIPEGEPE